MKILIVDDDPSLRQMLEVTFDFDDRIALVRSTDTPEGALELAAEIRPDVVVVDNVLTSDGSEIGMHLRRVLPSARLISFSGSEHETDWADVHITKNGESVANLTQAIFSDAAGSKAGEGLDEDEIRRFIHDLRNPIGALVGFAHILKTRKSALSEEKQAHVIDSMFKTSERLSKMVDEFAARHRDQQ